MLHVHHELDLQLCVALGQGKNMRRIPVNDLYYRLLERENACSSSIHSLAAMLFQSSVEK